MFIIVKIDKTETYDINNIMIDSDENLEKLSEEELDEKIQDLHKKIDIAYSMGKDGVVDQLLFYLDNLKMALYDKLEKQRFEITQGKIPTQYDITDDDLSQENND